MTFEPPSDKLAEAYLMGVQRSRMRLKNEAADGLGTRLIGCHIPLCMLILIQ